MACSAGLKLGAATVVSRAAAQCGVVACSAAATPWRWCSGSGVRCSGHPVTRRLITLDLGPVPRLVTLPPHADAATHERLTEWQRLQLQSKLKYDHREPNEKLPMSLRQSLEIYLNAYGNAESFRWALCDP